MKSQGLETKGRHNKSKKEIKAIRKDVKKQENKKPATPTPTPAAAPQGKPECKKCGKNTWETAG